MQLLRAGANVQAVGAEGSTALHEAIARGNHREALLLLSAGANPFCENNGGALRGRSKSLFWSCGCPWRLKRSLADFCFSGGAAAAALSAPTWF